MCVCVRVCDETIMNGNNAPKALPEFMTIMTNMRREMMNIIDDQYSTDCFHSILDKEI